MQVVEDRSDPHGKASHFLCNASDFFGFDEADGKASESRDIFRAIAGANAATVFVEVPIDDVVAAILDAPVAAIDAQNCFGVGLLGGSAGDAIGQVVGVFSALLVYGFPLDQEGLSHMGEIEIGVEI